jgi:uncharacterized protein (DUF433 family)
MDPVLAKHIEKKAGVCGGKACVAGTRIRVQDVYVWHELRGQSPDEIVTNFPQLTLADVHAALAYYWDNTQEIQQEMARADALVEQLKQTSPTLLQEKLRGTDASGSQVSS